MPPDDGTADAAPFRRRLAALLPEGTPEAKARAEQFVAWMRAAVASSPDGRSGAIADEALERGLGE